MCNYVTYNRFYKRRFYIYICCFLVFPCMPKLNACNIP